MDFSYPLIKDQQENLPLLALKRLGLGVPCGDAPLEDEAIAWPQFQLNFLNLVDMKVDCQVVHISKTKAV